MKVHKSSYRDSKCVSKSDMIHDQLSPHASQEKKSPSYFILDVDGVLTDGTSLYSENGKIYKTFGPHDHDGLKLIKDLVPVVFVTADKRGFGISSKRIKDMGYDLLLVSENDRFNYLMTRYDLASSVYMGDGLHDAKILRSSRFGIAPANARIEAKNAADFITNSIGGQGAVLDAVLKVLEYFFPQEYERLLAKI